MGNESVEVGERSTNPSGDGDSFILTFLAATIIILGDGRCGEQKEPSSRHKVALQRNANRAVSRV